MKLKDMDLIIKPDSNSIEFIIFNSKKRKVILRKKYNHNLDGRLHGLRQFQLLELGNMCSFVAYKLESEVLLFPLEHNGPIE